MILTKQMKAGDNHIACMLPLGHLHIDHVMMSFFPALTVAVQHYCSLPFTYIPGPSDFFLTGSSSLSSYSASVTPAKLKLKAMSKSLFHRGLHVNPTRIGERFHEY